MVEAIDSGFAVMITDIEEAPHSHLIVYFIIKSPFFSLVQPSSSAAGVIKSQFPLGFNRKQFRPRVPTEDLLKVGPEFREMTWLLCSIAPRKFSHFHPLFLPRHMKASWAPKWDCTTAWAMPPLRRQLR